MDFKKFPPNVRNTPISCLALPKRRPTKASTKTSISDCLIQRPFFRESQYIPQTLSQRNTGLQSNPRPAPAPVMLTGQKFTKAGMLQNCITNMECSKMMRGVGGVISTSQSYQSPLYKQKLNQMSSQSIITLNRSYAQFGNYKNPYDSNLGKQASSCISDSVFNKSMYSQLPYCNNRRNDALLRKENSNIGSIPSQTIQNIDYANYTTPMAYFNPPKITSQVYNAGIQSSRLPDDRPSELLFLGDISFFDSNKINRGESVERTATKNVHFPKSPEISNYQHSKIHSSQKYQPSNEQKHILPSRPQLANDTVSKSASKRPLLAVYQLSAKEINEPTKVNDSTEVAQVAFASESDKVHDKAKIENPRIPSCNTSNLNETDKVPRINTIYQSNKLFQGHQRKETLTNVSQNKGAISTNNFSQQAEVQNLNNIAAYHITDLKTSASPQKPRVSCFGESAKTYASQIPQTLQKPAHHLKADNVSKYAYPEDFPNELKPLIGTKKPPIIQKPVGPPINFVRKSASVKTPNTTPKSILVQKPGYVHASILGHPKNNFSQFSHIPSGMQGLMLQQPNLTCVGATHTCLQNFNTLGQNIAPTNQIGIHQRPVLSEPSDFSRMSAHKDRALPQGMTNCYTTVIQKWPNNEQSSTQFQKANQLIPLTGLLKPAGVQSFEHLKAATTDGKFQYHHYMKDESLNTDAIPYTGLEMDESKRTHDAKVQTLPNTSSEQQTENTSLIPCKKTSYNNDSSLGHTLREVNTQTNTEVDERSSSNKQNENKCNRKLEYPKNVKDVIKSESQHSSAIKTTEKTAGDTKHTKEIDSSTKIGAEQQSVNLSNSKMNLKHDDQCKPENSEICISKKTLRCDNCGNLIKPSNSVDTSSAAGTEKYTEKEFEGIEQFSLVPESCVRIQDSSSPYPMETHYLEIQIPMVLPRTVNVHKSVESKRTTHSQLIKKKDHKTEQATVSGKSGTSPSLQEISMCHHGRIYEHQKLEESSIKSDEKSVCSESENKPPVIIYHKYIPAALKKVNEEAKTQIPHEDNQDEKRALSVSFKESNSSEEYSNKSLKKSKQLTQNITFTQKVVSDSTIQYNIKPSKHTVANFECVNSTLTYDKDKIQPEIQVLHDATKASFYAINDNSDYGSNDMIKIRVSDVNISHNDNNVYKNETTDKYKDTGLHYTDVAEKSMKCPICSKHLEKISDESVKSKYSEVYEPQKYKRHVTTTILESEYENPESERSATHTNRTCQNISENNEVVDSGCSRQSSVQHPVDSYQYRLEQLETGVACADRDCLLEYLSVQPAIVDNVVSRVTEDLLKQLGLDSGSSTSMCHQDAIPIENQSHSVPTTVQMLPETSTPTVQMLPEGSMPTVQILPDGGICQTSTSNVCLVPTGKKKLEKGSNIYQIAHQIGNNRFLLLDHVIPNRQYGNQASVNPNISSATLSALQRVIDYEPTPPAPPEYTIMAYTTHHTNERPPSTDPLERHPDKDATYYSQPETSSNGRTPTQPSRWKQATPNRRIESTQSSGRRHGTPTRRIESTSSCRRKSSNSCRGRSSTSRERRSSASCHRISSTPRERRSSGSCHRISSTSSNRRSSTTCQRRSATSAQRSRTVSGCKTASLRSCSIKSNHPRQCACKPKEPEPEPEPSPQREERNDITVPPTVFAHHPESTIGTPQEEFPEEEPPAPTHVFDITLKKRPQQESCGKRECPQDTCGPPCAVPPNIGPFKDIKDTQQPPAPKPRPVDDSGPVETTYYPAADYRLLGRRRKAPPYKPPPSPKKRLVADYIDPMGVKRQRVICTKPVPCMQPTIKKKGHGLPKLFKERPHSTIGEMPYKPLISTVKKRYCRFCTLEICPGEELILKRQPPSGVEVMEREIVSTMLDQEIEFRRPRCLLDNYSNFLIPSQVENA